jgi:hypothetical protein
MDHGNVERFWIFLLLIAAILTGCPNAAVVGLDPVYPPAEMKPFSFYCEFAEVDSLQPVFCWQPFELSPEEQETEEVSKTGDIEVVTYEIRIWRTTAGRRGKLVYGRSGLTETHHRLEEPLAPGTRYLWSVRAHFSLKGRRRTTEWSLAGYALRNEAVPNESCLRFRTPD